MVVVALVVVVKVDKLVLACPGRRSRYPHAAKAEPVVTVFQYHQVAVAGIARWAAQKVQFVPTASGGVHPVAPVRSGVGRLPQVVQPVGAQTAVPAFFLRQRRWRAKHVLRYCRLVLRRTQRIPAVVLAVLRLGKIVHRAYKARLRRLLFGTAVEK